ncbi:hypothetical protein Syun_021801 [Stephania yunnanensis]|uniref:Uncharacterized protein n=1 Tax=Stephania yunnanensis TaxID=152371 RepID=A0AAP0IG94_9MAGN
MIVREQSTQIGFFFFFFFFAEETKQGIFGEIQNWEFSGEKISTQNPESIGEVKCKIPAKRFKGGVRD